MTYKIYANKILIKATICSVLEIKGNDMKYNTHIQQADIFYKKKLLWRESLL